MSTRTKVLLVLVAVALVVLFAGAAANQRDTGTGDANSSNALVDFLGARAGSGTKVADDEIVTACRIAPNTLQFNGSCTLTIAPSGTGLRSLVLSSSNAVTVTSRVPRKDFTVTGDLSPGKQLRVAIDEQGAEVGLDCAASECVITVEDGQ